MKAFGSWCPTVIRFLDNLPFSSPTQLPKNWICVKLFNTGLVGYRKLYTLISDNIILTDRLIICYVKVQ